MLVELFDVSEDMPVDDEDDVSLLLFSEAEPEVLPVPLAPIEDVLLFEPLAVVELLLGLDELIDELLELLGELAVEPAPCDDGPLEFASLFVLEALVPPVLPALEPPVCAIAIPPTARAAAAARVVRVVFNMSCSLND